MTVQVRCTLMVLRLLMGAGRVSLAGPADVESNPDENTIALLNLKVPSWLGGPPPGVTPP